MAIKYLNNNVNIINYEDKDVKKVILDSDIVWCKPFTYTIGTLPTGVASLTCTRYSNDEPSASTGTIANGGTIYYGDTLYWSATAATGYNNPTVTYDGSTAAKRYTVTGNVTGVTASGVQAGSIKTYSLTLASTYGHWTNAGGTTVTSTTAANYGTAVSVSGNVLTVGTNTYTFIINSDTAQYDYEFDSITGAPASITGTSTVTGTATRTTKQYTITWRYRTAYNTWTTDTTVYEYGATPLVDSPVSGTVPTPATQTSGNYRYTFKEWPDVVAVTQNKQYQANYYYQFNITSLTQTYTNAYTDNTYSTAFSTGWHNSNTVIYWKAKTNYYYGSTSSSTTSTTTVVAGTNTNNPTYLKWSAGTYNYCTPSPASGSIVAVGSSITWTASSGYSFAEGTTQTSTSTSTVVLGTLSYAKTPGYRYVSINNTNCTSTISTGYRAYPRTITWTPSTGTNYKYSFTNTTSYDPTDAQRKTTASFTATGTNSFTKSPSYRYYNTQFYYEYDSWLSEYDGDEIVSDPGSGQYVNEWHYLLGGSSVEFSNKANDNNIHCAFSEDDPLDLIYTFAINSAGMQINDNMSYYTFYHCTFSGTNTDASSQTNWYQYGDTVTITANSSTTYKYSFSNSNPASPTTTKTHNITTYGSFTYNASYQYYKVTINASSTGPTNYQSLFASSSSSATSGTTVGTGTQWILKNYYLRAQALADPDSYDKYNFSNSDDTATKWTTSSQITTSTTWNIPTMYKWIYFTSYSNPSHGHADVTDWNSLRSKWLLCSSWSSIDGWSYPLPLQGSYYYGYLAVFDSYTGSTTKTEYRTSGGAITLTSIAKFKAEIRVHTFSSDAVWYEAVPKCSNQSYYSQIRTYVEYATDGSTQKKWTGYARFTNSSGSGTGSYIYWPNYTGTILPYWKETTLKYIRLHTSLLVSASSSDFWAQPSGTYNYYTLDPSTSHEFD